MNALQRAEAIAAAIESSQGDDETALEWSEQIRQLGRDCASMEGRLRAGGVEVAICADPKTDGSTLEAVAHLPIIPRKGDRLEVVIPSGTVMLDVKLVMLPTYRSRSAQVEVWVEIEGYDREDLEEAIESLKDNYGDEDGGAA